ncbi:aminoacyl-tRNA hydrolase [Synechococcus sp. CS-1325]|uniref:alternative ribosome rescue aminoacyl-tRNA hydrolase ArfB n=1 Tax=Synechococcus sp. CS-1325 TaxID=2847979 RepID=UPI000DB7E9BB|nr:alternative ribosome rescue aminoacyl-tRNA hydrolase ArfB [Synechococcus sp. CS-1325]MCT0200031.1 aminoacyl-tRNA hydrolase [Synechococcus sp. CS-1325]PZU98608.1 MAG: aminoacyl-tRNA hydrolase [Cyanobium sp.]
MAADLAITAALTIPATELGWRFSRAGGPGGQGVNTTDSRVELVFPLATSSSLPPLLRERALRRLGGTLVDGAVVIVAAEHRSQWLNRQAALRRLKALLAEAIAPPPPPRRSTRPTGGSVQRRLAAKRRRAQAKQQRRDQGSSDD